MKASRNKFVFLYPERECFEYEIRIGTNKIKREWDTIHKVEFLRKIHLAGNEEEKAAIQEEARESRMRMFKPFYVQLLNDCINQRYREKGYQIVFVTLKGVPIERSIIQVRRSDVTIELEINKKIHQTRRERRYNYPNQDTILDRLLPVNNLVIGGFHYSDCVQRFARQVYRKGINVLVDEDITDLLISNSTHEGFREDVLGTAKPWNQGTEEAIRDEQIELLQRANRRKPWLLQYDDFGDRYFHPSNK